LPAAPRPPMPGAAIWTVSWVSWRASIIWMDTILPAYAPRTPALLCPSTGV